MILFMTEKPLLEIDLPETKKLRSGKVREVFDLGDRLLMVATDRISAFDCIMPNGIPRKGEILTRISNFWFQQTAGLCPNHLLSEDESPWPSHLEPFKGTLEGRSMWVRKTDPLPIECVVRGYLAGSGWKEYQQNGTVCSISLPSGLRESDRLPEPIFTPATKAQSGHDENITFEQAAECVGIDRAREVREMSLKIYQYASTYAAERGIIVADTKFEFGVVEGKLILIDEVLTPDSSRFWPAKDYLPGRSQVSFDKQFVRDYLESLDWDKTPPAPKLPEEVIEKTCLKYAEVFEKLTGHAL